MKLEELLRFADRNVTLLLRDGTALGGHFEDNAGEGTILFFPWQLGSIPSGHLMAGFTRDIEYGDIASVIFSPKAGKRPMRLPTYPDLEDSLRSWLYRANASVAQVNGTRDRDGWHKLTDILLTCGCTLRPSAIAGQLAPLRTCSEHTHLKIDA
jgi:hypothetical protein